ncbi:hypothetical protein D3C72_2419510 [compost metagenome]
MQRDPVQIIVVERQATQRRVCCLRQLLECLAIECRLQGPAIIGNPRAPFGIEQHTAVLAANGQHQNL